MHLRATWLPAILAIAMSGLLPSRALAVVTVNGFGQYGWDSTDTRVAGVNAVTPGDIGSRLQFVDPAILGSDGALKLITPAGNDKATLANVNTSPGLGVLDSTFTASYRWAKDSPAGPGAAPAPAFKLGIATSQLGGTGSSSKIGENNWDKILIYEPYDNPDQGDTPAGTWVTQNISFTSGDFWMFDRTSGTAVNPPHGSLTLSAWLADPTYGSLLANGKVVDLALGQGSGNPNGVGYVDWVSSNLLAGITPDGLVNFVAVPEAGAFMFAGLACVTSAGITIYRTRGSKNTKKA